MTFGASALRRLLSLGSSLIAVEKLLKLECIIQQHFVKLEVLLV